MNASLKELASRIDGLIRAGQGSRARTELKALVDRKLARDERLPFVALARRANLPLVGIQLLGPILRSERKSPVVPTAKEKAEYAACLIKIGANEEALELLGKMDAGSQPEVLLFRSFALVSDWRYAESIPILEKYVASSGLTEYQRWVGNTNLAAALVHEGKLPRAEALLKRLIRDTGKGHALLQGTALGYLAEILIVRGELDMAKRCLDEAHELLKDMGTIDEFFIRKWKAVLAYVRGFGSPRARSLLDGIREEAVSRRHWETVRHCDRFVAVYRRDQALLAHLYFGSPSESFRAKLLRDFGGGTALPATYAWRLGPDRGPAVELELLTRGRDPKGRELKPGQTSHRLLAILASDFYRPIRLAPLHRRLFPTEYFNPISSPFRVYQAVQRLRAWLSSSGVPLEIRVKDGEFSLAAKRACVLQVPGAEVSSKKHLLPLQKLKEACSRREFTLTEAVGIWHLPRRSALRLIESAVGDNGLERLGKGRSTRYRFRTEP